VLVEYMPLHHTFAPVSSVCALGCQHWNCQDLNLLLMFAAGGVLYDGRGTYNDVIGYAERLFGRIRQTVSLPLSSNMCLSAAVLGCHGKLTVPTHVHSSWQAAATPQCCLAEDITSAAVLL
jgi:hypothetical protein